MKIKLIGSGIHLALISALAQSKGFEVTECDRHTETTTPPICAPASAYSFDREHRLREKSHQRKQMKKPARKGGKP